MTKAHINPWSWQDSLGYSQAVEIRHSDRTLYCAGQAAMNGAGQPVAGTMEEQMQLCLHNLEQVIRQAGYAASNIVRLNLYTTSTADFFAAYGTLASWMNNHGCAPSSTLVEVKALAFPQLSIEIEATVVG